MSTRQTSVAVYRGLCQDGSDHNQTMSEEQLSALLVKFKEDAGLREKLKGASDLDTAVAMAQEAGFDVTKADWLKYQAKQTLELSDEELEGVAGGVKWATQARADRCQGVPSLELQCGATLTSKSCCEG